MPSFLANLGSCAAARIVLCCLGLVDGIPNLFSALLARQSQSQGNLAATGALADTRIGTAAVKNDLQQVLGYQLVAG